jgi:hypothetical protein
LKSGFFAEIDGLLAHHIPPLLALSQDADFIVSQIPCFVNIFSLHPVKDFSQESIKKEKSNKYKPLRQNSRSKSFVFEVAEHSSLKEAPSSPNLISPPKYGTVWHFWHCLALFFMVEYKRRRDTSPLRHRKTRSAKGEKTG